ncbi:MAG: LysM peptidoglycan-binding domain-containing protein [Desulfobacterales bacterium]|nr:MAG: LysM peptidoglycan-binding domain-containing protein [Desulfobacterales bacterium]
MEQKDSDIKFKLNSAPQEDYIDDEDDLHWNKKKKNVFSRLFKMPEDIPYSWLAIGGLFLVVLFILIFSRSESKVSEKQILAMETRLKRLEEMVNKTADVDEKVTRIWEQAKDFEQFKARFERSEASLLLRLDNLSKNVNRLQKRVAESRPVKTERSKTDKAADRNAKQKHHTVRPGETLYSISRQYGLTVAKIRLMNKLAEGTAIHPGQKLLVRP